MSFCQQSLHDMVRQLPLSYLNASQLLQWCENNNTSKYRNNVHWTIHTYMFSMFVLMYNNNITKICSEAKITLSISESRWQCIKPSGCHLSDTESIPVCQRTGTQRAVRFLSLFSEYAWDLHAIQLMCMIYWSPP